MRGRSRLVLLVRLCTRPAEAGTCRRFSSEPVDASPQNLWTRLLGAGRPINDDLHASAGGSRRDPGVDLELSLSGEPDGSS